MTMHIVLGLPKHPYLAYSLEMFSGNLEDFYFNKATACLCESINKSLIG